MRCLKFLLLMCLVVFNSFEGQTGNSSSRGSGGGGGGDGGGRRFSSRGNSRSDSHRRTRPRKSVTQYTFPGNCHHSATRTTMSFDGPTPPPQEEYLQQMVQWLLE